MKELACSKVWHNVAPAYPSYEPKEFRLYPEGVGSQGNTEIECNADRFTS